MPEETNASLNNPLTFSFDLTHYNPVKNSPNPSN